MEKGKKSVSVILVSLLCSYLATIGALLILSFLLYKMKLGDTAADIGVVAIYLCATFLGGLLAGRKLHSRKYLWGLLTGALYFGVLWLVSLAMPGAREGGILHFLSSMALCLLGGMLGGMFG